MIIDVNFPLPFFKLSLLILLSGEVMKGILKLDPGRSISLPVISDDTIIGILFPEAEAA